MEHSLDQINWIAVLVCLVAGQALLTIWFVVLFADPWARAYGGEGMTKAQHAKEIPGHTYAIGALCVFVLSLGISALQAALEVEEVVGALHLALMISLTVFVPMALPAYAFLKRWSAFVIGAGSQVVLACVISVILAAWN